MSRYAKDPKKISIRFAAMTVAAFGLFGCGATSNASSFLGTVSGVADVVSAGARIAFFTEGLGGVKTFGIVPRYPGGSTHMDTLGFDFGAMETAIDVMDAADDVSAAAADAARDAAFAEQIMNPLLNPPSAAD